MTALRTVFSALCIVVSAIVIIFWALAHVAVNAVEDGTAVRGMTERALNSQAVRDALSNDLTSRTVAALRDQGVDLVGLGLEGTVNEVISRGIATDAFRSTVLEQVEDAQAQVSEQLTDPARQPSPLAITVDLSQSVNARLGDVGGPIAALPSLSLPAVTMEVLDTHQFEQTRFAYGGLRWLQKWGLWAGLAVLALGLLISSRRRWFVPKVLLAIGVAGVGVGVIIAARGPESFVMTMAGDGDGAWAIVWRDLISQDAVRVVMTRSLWVGGIALAGAAVATALALVLGAKRK